MNGELPANAPGLVAVMNNRTDLERAQVELAESPARLGCEVQKAAVLTLARARPPRGHPVAAYHSDQLSEHTFKLLAAISIMTPSWLAW